MKGMVQAMKTLVSAAAIAATVLVGGGSTDKLLVGFGGFWEHGQPFVEFSQKTYGNRRKRQLAAGFVQQGFHGSGGGQQTVALGLTHESVIALKGYFSGQDVELAVEKARSSRLETVTQVKQAFYGVLLAKEAFNVYKEVYENALENFQQTEKKYNADKASELDYQRAKSTVQNAIPNVYDADNAVALGLWQLKAVMGIDLDENIDVAGSLMDYADVMPLTVYADDELSLENNSSLRQLGIQAEELANNIKIQQYASLPSLALSFSYSLNAMTNDFKFSEYNWSPYSAVGLSLSIPIFAGGKRANAVRQARNQYEQLGLQSENAERQLKIAIRQYLNQMETSMKNFSSAESGVETARKAYDIASKSYNLGRSTITELNNAQLALTQAQLAQSQAVYSFMTAKASLEQTLGKDFNEE